MKLKGMLETAPVGKSVLSLPVLWLSRAPLSWCTWLQAKASHTALLLAASAKALSRVPD